jgi:hypothetical protein
VAYDGHARRVSFFVVNRQTNSARPPDRPRGRVVFVAMPLRFASSAWLIGSAMTALAGAGSRAQAQDVTAEQRAKFLIATPDLGSAIAPGGFFRGAPGTNSGTPFAFGPDLGDFYLGGGYQSQTRGGKSGNGTLAPNGDADGAIAIGFGLGDARRLVGLEVTATAISNFRTGYPNRPSGSFKLNRMIGSTAAIAVGVEDLFQAGRPNTNFAGSIYGVASKVFLFNWGDESSGSGGALTVSAGVGNGRFRMLDDVNKKVNGFGSAAFMFNQYVSVLTEYTGQDVNVGLSLVPVARFPLVLTPAIADVTGTASKTARFVLGVGLGAHF